MATFVERKTRLYLAFKIPDRTSKSMFSAIQELCKLIPKDFLKTFISDRGKEFACYPLVEELTVALDAINQCPRKRLGYKPA